MAKKVKMKKARQVKELFDLEIDEVSAVDKPAIGEEFYITKSMNKNKGATVTKPVKKSVTWKQIISKGVSEDNTHCVFCGITKEEESVQIGMGLIKGVCFECAIEHAEKGVFDACIAGTFDAEAFQKENPDFALKLKLDLQKGEDEEVDDESGDEEDEEEVDDESDDEEDEEEVDDESDDEEDEESEKSSKDNPASSEEDGQESDVNTSLEKKVVKLEKSIEDVTAMLERSLELHDMAASALNEIVALTFGSLDGLMMMMQDNQQMSDGTKTLFTEINESIKSEREMVSKKGAKISAKRIAVLQEISAKLSELLTSVMEDGKDGTMTKSVTDIHKSLESMKEELTEAIQESSSSIKEDIESKLKEMQSKLEDIEQSGGASFDLGDEDESDEEESSETEKSIFSDIVGISDIKKNIDRKRRNLK